MKKTTEAWKRWHALRAKNEARRRGHSGASWGYFALKAPSKRRVTRVQIWQGGDPEWALCLSRPVSPPEPFCLNQNRDETVRAFRKMRDGFNAALREDTTFVSRPLTPGAMPRIPTYFDFAQVSYISTASAVILAAEYDRMRMLQSEVPPTVELDRWNKEVFTKLYQLGFFDITGHTPSNDQKLTESTHSLSMRIVRSTTADDLVEIDVALQKLFAFLGSNGTATESIIIGFLTALSEAMVIPPLINRV